MSNSFFPFKIQKKNVIFKEILKYICYNFKHISIEFLRDFNNSAPIQPKI